MQNVYKDKLYWWQKTSGYNYLMKKKLGHTNEKADHKIRTPYRGNHISSFRKNMSSLRAVVPDDEV